MVQGELLTAAGGLKKQVPGEVQGWLLVAVGDPQELASGEVQGGLQDTTAGLSKERGSQRRPPRKPPDFWKWEKTFKGTSYTKSGGGDRGS